MEYTMDERKEVNVGRPLIAKLGLHHGFKANNCLQTCCLANNPFPNHMESSPVATEYFIPSHCQPNSYPGIYLPNHVCSDGIRQPEVCSCNGILASRREVGSYQTPVGESNVPVETTDDTVELEFLLSDKLRFSKQQYLWCDMENEFPCLLRFNMTKNSISPRMINMPFSFQPQLFSIMDFFLQPALK